MQMAARRSYDETWRWTPIVRSNEDNEGDFACGCDEAITRKEQQHPGRRENAMMAY